MNREQKGVEIKNLAGFFSSAKSIIFAHNRGLKVSEVTELRRKLRGEKNEFKVVKNRLAKIALKEMGLAGLDDFFKGPVTVTSATADAISPVKILVNFAKDHEKLELAGGYMDGEVLGIDKIKALANLPSREVLYAKLLGCLQNPARQLVSVLAAVPRGLVTAVDAIKKQKETNS